MTPHNKVSGVSWKEQAKTTSELIRLAIQIGVLDVYRGKILISKSDRDKDKWVALGVAQKEITEYHNLVNKLKGEWGDELKEMAKKALEYRGERDGLLAEKKKIIKLVEDKIKEHINCKFFHEIAGHEATCLDVILHEFVARQKK